MTDMEFLDEMCKHSEYFGSLNFIYLCGSSGSSEFSECKRQYERLMKLEVMSEMISVKFHLGVPDLKNKMIDMHYAAHFDAGRKPNQWPTDHDRQLFLDEYPKLEKELEELESEAARVHERRREEYRDQVARFREACINLAKTFPYLH